MSKISIKKVFFAKRARRQKPWSKALRRIYVEEGVEPIAGWAVPSSSELNKNKTKVISADLLDLDFYFVDIIMFGNISVLVTFKFW